MGLVCTSLIRPVQLLIARRESPLKRSALKRIAFSIITFVSALALSASSYFTYAAPRLAPHLAPHAEQHTVHHAKQRTVHHAGHHASPQSAAHLSAQTQNEPPQPLEHDRLIEEVPLPHYRAQVSAALEEARADVEARVGFAVPYITIYLSADERAMRALAERHHGHAPPSWSGGLAFSRSRQVYLPAQSPRELSSLLRHELAHIAIGARSEPRRIPLWVNEGVAVALGEGLSLERVQTLNEAATLGELSSFSSLERHFPEHGKPAQIAYAQSGHMISYITQRVGVNAFQRWLEAVCEGEGPTQASLKHFPSPLPVYEQEWRASLERGILAQLGLLMKSETLWAIAILIFVMMGMRRLKSRRAEALRRPDRTPPPQIRTSTHR